jgi:carbamoyl-phosphate synthase large subunit
VSARAPSTAVRAIVTGAGGAAGVAVIRALRVRGHQTVAADACRSAVGLRLADDGAVVPLAEHPDFVAEICELGRRSSANVLISTVSEEMTSLARASAELDAAGLRHWLPPPETVEICRDKWRFALACRAAGVPIPTTGLSRPDGVPGPWVVKPRYGRGSRDVYWVDEDEDFSWPLRRVADPLWQTRLAGREFTVDVLVARDGTVAAAVPRWRSEVKSGISTKGVTFVDDILAAKVGDVVAAIGIRAVANVQGFMTLADGPVFTEVNPRFSGGLPLSLAAGADLVGEYLSELLGGPLRPERLTFQPGVSMTRHFDEVFDC